MKKVLAILIILGFGFRSIAQADDTQSTIHTDANRMLIIGNGIGKSVEQAKIAAIKDILSQFSDEEIITSLPNSYTYTKSAKDDIAISSEGLEELLAKLYAKAKWQLKDGTYHYSIEILIRREIPETDTKL